MLFLKERKVEDNEDRRAESSSDIKINREAPEMVVILEQEIESTREDDVKLSNDESQPHSLDFVVVPHRKKEPQEGFEGNGLKRYIIIQVGPNSGVALFSWLNSGDVFFLSSIL